MTRKTLENFKIEKTGLGFLAVINRSIRKLSDYEEEKEKKKQKK